MNITIFTDSYLPNKNGVSYSIKRQAAVLKEKGHKVVIIGPDYLDVDIKIKSLILFTTKDKNYSFSIPLVSMTHLRNTIESDMVCIHTPFSIGMLAIRFAKKHNIPIVFTHHTNLNYYFHYLPYLNNSIGKYMLSRLYGAFLKSTDVIITPSESSMLQLIKNYKIDAGKVKVLPTPINEDILSSMSTCSEKIYDFILVGRLSQEKNIFLAIESIKIIISKIPNVKVAIIGDGIKKNDVELTLNQYLGENVFLLGEMDNSEVQKNISQSHFLLFPSISETQGLVMQEAWANEVPVIAISCELIKEYIVEGSNGWYTRNNPSDFAQKAIALINELRQDTPKFNINCKVHMENFSSSSWYKLFCKKIIENVSL